MRQALRFVPLLSVFFLPTYAQASMACDVDSDGDVDVVDIRSIIAARNQPATGPDDPRDPDRDGVITILDARQCVLRCSLPGCEERQSNIAPLADAGPDRTVNVGELVTLNGSGSVDPEGEPLTFTWGFLSVPAGSTVALSDSSAVMPTFTPDVEGEYQIELIVNDGVQDSAPDEVIVVTVPGNTAPVADAGPDQTVFVTETVLLDGSGSSDVDGDLLSFFWTISSLPAGSSATLSDPTSLTPSFAVDLPGTYIVELVVDDGQAASLPDSVVITTENSAPVADAGPDQSVDLFATVNLDGTFSFDIDGDVLTFSWSLSSVPAGSSAALDDASSATPSFVADVAGTYVAQLVVNDGVLDSFADATVVTTANTQPVADAGVDQTVTLDDTVQLDGSQSSDADGDSLTYDWSLIAAPVGSTAILSDPFAVTPTFPADAAGTFVVQLIVNDGFLDSDPDTATVTVEVFDTEAPDVPDLAFISVSLPVDGEIAVTGLPGAVEANALVVIENLSTGETVVAQADADGAFSASIAAEEGDELRIRAVDGADNASDPASTLVPGSLPDPATIAPTLPMTGLTPFADSTAFLYSGPSPIQSGLSPDTIEADFAAVVRGSVTTRSGQPLPDVMVTVLDRPEYGATRSRADGQYDLAVNGSDTVVIQFERSGFLPVQRRVLVPPRDYAIVDNVILTQLDPAATTVAFGVPTTQVHRSSASEDVDGSREATVLILPNTGATMRFADGSSQPLASGQIRATEFTVGLDGLQAMPGELPAPSAYTYATELSLDEAIAAGATSVEFSRPVSVFVDNFLEIPVGSRVPVGSFDRQRASWVPEDDGVVLQILAVDGNGLAELDVDGSATAATAEQLLALDISDDERRQIASSLAPQSTFWRFQAPHFTPFDCNWAYDFPEDAVTPPDDEDPVPPDDDDDVDCEGCRIDVQSQALQHDVPVVGTDIGLHYRSDRQGARDDDVLITPDVVPDSLLFVRASVRIAGQTIELGRTGFGNRLSDQLQSPEPGLRLPFGWSGADAYGRSVVGAIPATIKITYYYPAVYVGTGRARRAFAAQGNGSVIGRAATITDSEGNRIANRFITATRVITRLVRTQDPAVNQLGGWTLTPHHSFDIRSRQLTFGPGGQRKVDTDPPTIRNVSDTSNLGVAGIPLGTIGGIDFVRQTDNFTAVAEVCAADTDNRIVYCGWTDETRGTSLGIVAGGGSNPPTDGVDARSVDFDAPSDLSAPDQRNLYVVSASANRVWRLFRDRLSSPFTLQLIAGTGSAGSDGDGGLAVAASLNVPTNVVAQADGTVYVSESAGHRVRRITPDGIIETLAGTGTAGFSGDNGPADLAQLDSPAGLAVGSDGSVYVADRGNRRVRRIDPAGMITTVAGDGAPCSATEPCGDNGAATAAQLESPSDVAAFNDGRLVIADGGSRRIRIVRGDGVIIPYIGDGQPAWTNAPVSNQEAAGRADLSETLSIAVAGRSPGLTLIGDRNVLRSVGSRQANFVTNELLTVPSEDGEELFVFSSATGRHLRTLETVSRIPVYEFDYDADGLLTTISDRNQNVLEVERTPEGTPIAIVAPFGQRTALERDGNGFLSSIENPAGEAFQFEYTLGGLMTQMSDPRNLTSTFSYDDNGRLAGDTDAAGGGWTLTRTVGESAFGTASVKSATVTIESREGRATQTTWSTDGRLLETIFPDGTSQRTIKRTTSNDWSAEFSDGSEQVYRGRFDSYLFPHARLGTIEQRMPSGLTSVVTTSRQYQGSPDADPLRPDTFLAGGRIERVNLNGNVWSTNTDRLLRTMQITSPENRVSTTAYDALWRPVSIMRQGVAEETRQYDLRGRLERLSTGTGTEARTTTFGYFDAGPSAGRLESIVDAEDRVSRFEYDAAGRVTRQTLPGDRSVSFTYDANGNLASLTPPGGLPHVFEYTAVDDTSAYRPPAAGLPQSATTYQFNLDRQLTSVVRPDGQELRIGYDSAGKKSTVTTPRGITTYSYDGTTGQPSAISTPDGVTLGLTFDGALLAGNTWSGPLAGMVSFDYTNDFFVSAVSVNGEVIDYVYDRDGLVTGAGALTITRASDSGFEAGTSIDQVATGTGYNDFGELETFSATIPGTSQSEVADAIRAELAVLQGILDELAIDCIRVAPTQFANLLAAAAALPAETAAYDEAFAIFVARFNNSRGTLLFECSDKETLVAEAEALFDELEALRVALDLPGGGDTSLLTAEYVRDRLGRITQKTEMVEGIEAVYDYSYDEAGRLAGVQVDGAVSETYSYDANGNRLISSGTSASYDDQDRLVAFGGTTFSYTANGELLTRDDNGQVTSYDYDLLGNLREVTLPDGTQIEYVVDGQNRRVGKRVDGTLVSGFLYQSQVQIVAELDGTGAVLSRFVYGTKDNTPDYMTRDGRTYRIVTDHLGSPRLVVDTVSGEIAQRMDYDTFGNVTVDTNPGFQPFGFAGGLYDRDTGLVRFGARDYDPQVGRWTSKDPIGFLGGDTNLYGYVLHDPVNLVDPFGLFCLSADTRDTVIGGISGALGGAVTGAISGGVAGALIGAGVGGVSGAVSGAFSAQSRLGQIGSGAALGAAGGAIESALVGGGKGGVIGGAIGGAVGGSPGGAIGGAIGGAFDPGASRLAKAGNALKAGTGGLLGGLVSELASVALGKLISECECE